MRNAANFQWYLSAGLLTMGLLLTGRVLAADAPQSPAAPGQAPSMPEGRWVDRGQFCSSLQTVFADFAVNRGESKVAAKIFATQASIEIVEQMRAGKATDFLSIKALGQLPAGGDKAYLNLAQVLSAVVQLGGHVNLALSTEDLRFLPYAEPGSELVVLATSAKGLTPDRAQKVVVSARSQGVRLHMLWLGRGSASKGEVALAPGDMNEAQALAWLALSTGGSFIDLGGDSSPCAPVY